jgi:hypothetical protein
VSHPGPSKPRSDPGHPSTKKALILEAARALKKENFTQVEVEQIRRQLIARLGPQGKTSSEYIVSVLQEAGFRFLTSLQRAADDLIEEEFQDLLHFSTLEEAEMSIIRLDELYRKFVAGRDTHTAERVLEVGRLGRRRAEMIARNLKVDPAKRAQKAEIARWFAIWLETPDAFFDWLEVRKKSPEFQAQFSEEKAE